MSASEWLDFAIRVFTFVALAGGAALWLRKQFVARFTEAVLEAVTPLQQAIDHLSQSISETNRNVEGALADRAVVVDRALSEIKGSQTSIHGRLGALEARVSRGTETVVEAVQAATPPAGDGGS